MEIFDKWIDYIRTQRHDFINDIQVIYGYLQMENNEKAKKYIEKIIERNDKIRDIYSLGDNYFAILMENNLKKLWNKGIKIELSIEIDVLLGNILKDEYDKKRNLVNNIFDEFENTKFKFVYIYIFEDNLGKNLFIANNESIVDELDWMEEWVEFDLKIKNVKLYKYNYKKDCAYKLTFV